MLKINFCDWSKSTYIGGTSVSSLYSICYCCTVHQSHFFLLDNSSDIAELQYIEDALRGLPSLHVLCVQGNPLCEQGSPPLQDLLRAVVPGLRELNGQSLSS